MVFSLHTTESTSQNIGRHSFSPCQNRVFFVPFHQNEDIMYILFLI